MKSSGRLFLMVTVLVLPPAAAVAGEEADVTLHDLQFSAGPPEAGFMLHALSGKLPAGKLSPAPAFEPEVTSYTVNVPNPLLTIRARAAAGMKMSVSGTASGGGELKISNRFSIGNANDHGAFLSATLSGLDAGENAVTVKVSDPEGDAARSYSLTVKRIATATATDPGPEDRQVSEVAPAAPKKTLPARKTDGPKELAGQDLLFSSIRKADPDGVRRAIETGADVNEPFPGKAGVSPLLWAVREENTEIVRSLIEAGADVSYTLPEQQFHSGNASGISALMLAADKANSEILQLLIDAGADVNHVLPEQGFPSRNATGASALLLAVKAGHEKIARQLIDAGADLDYALPEQSIHSNSTTGITALLLAVNNGQEAIVRTLLQAGADVNRTFPEQEFPARKSTGGVSALIVAVNMGHEEIVRLLIDGGADVKYRIPGKRRFGKNPNTAGLTALRVAQAKDHSGIVALLSKAGAER